MKDGIKIQKLAYGGFGICFFNEKICFVENALPGETVKIDITTNKKKYIHAKAIEILSASEKRIVPPCPYVISCGGCQYQHTAYEEELKWKEQQVREYLTRMVKLNPDIVQPIVPSTQEYGYRTSVTVHYKNSNVGFFAKDNKTLIPIETCLLLDPKLNTIFKNLPKSNREDITFRLDETGKTHSNLENNFLKMRVGNESITTHTRGFFQTNLEITQQIGKALKQWIEQSQVQTWIDLYCGSGTFSLLAAGSVKNWILAEENASSLKALEENLTEKNREAVIISGKVEDEFPDYFKKTPSKNAFVFLDPPRKGMETKLAQFLSRQNSIQVIGYLSCHLGTLVRDLELILKGGLFEIKNVIPFDMFPRTQHIEILTLLKRKA